ncbi:MAG: leucine-rich repeat protein [Muribaculaceae bacterium]|nr:leucine-rich repeat protein [Muribaculaceae bacterium]
MAISASAYDFMLNGLCYNINEDGASLTLTYQQNSNMEDTRPSYESLSENIIIPERVTYNGTVYSVTSIDNFAFYYCTDLLSVNIPNTVTEIGVGVFYGCSSLTSVTIPNSVTSIGNMAFENCSGLTSVTIPNSVTTIGSHAFVNTPWYDNQPDGLVYAGSVAYKYKGTMPNETNIVLKEGTRGIAGDCFYHCNGLVSIYIPNSVTVIGYEAFWCCSNLTSINIPNSVTTIDNLAFSYCGLTGSLIIPNSVTSIGGQAFGGCTGLTSINIGNSVTEIGIYAFAWCSGLNSVTIPNSVTSIGDNAFYNCSDLTSLTLTGYGTWNYNSNSHQGLSQFINQFKTINIGSGITYLGDFNFKPDIVNSYAATPPTCSSSTFSSYDGELHVPASSTAAYFTAEYWQNFANFNSDLTDKVTLNQSEATLVQWEEMTLGATVSPAGNELQWSSSDPSVAIVSDNGVVTAVKEGECDIFATLASNTAVYASCHITVNYPEITLSLDKDTILINLGEETTLTASIMPDNTGLTPVWTSSDQSVATVSNGVVMAVGEGECDITAKVLDKTAVCHVIVTGNVIITLDQHEVTIAPNQIITLTPTMSPTPTELLVSSSNQSVAVARFFNGSVQVIGIPLANGYFTSSILGETTITVSSASGNAIPDSCVVTLVASRGDANGDGAANVQDITTIINYILGNNPSPFVFETADLNTDGTINVQDVTTLINIILGVI